jgi:hydrogenase maturation protease
MLPLPNISPVVKTIVMGLGNPILGDDGVGWRVAQEVQRRLGGSSHGSTSPVVVEFSALGGMSLMEGLIGYEAAILVDALDLDAVPGTVLTFQLDELQNCAAAHTGCAHDTSLQQALKMGQAMGAPLPGKITVVGIAARRPYEFSETLSAEVEASVEPAARTVLGLLTPD